MPLRIQAAEAILRAFDRVEAAAVLNLKETSLGAMAEAVLGLDRGEVAARWALWGVRATVGTARPLIARNHELESRVFELEGRIGESEALSTVREAQFKAAYDLKKVMLLCSRHQALKEGLCHSRSPTQHGTRDVRSSHSRPLVRRSGLTATTIMKG